MRTTYHHLSLPDREKLYTWKESGVSLREIAGRLRRNVGSVSREWKRHTRYGKAYLPCQAQRLADLRARKQRYQAPLKCPLVFLYVREHLRLGWSPETIAGRLALDYPGYSIDKETIYRYIYSRHQRRLVLWRYLTLHRKRRLRKDGRKVTCTQRISGAKSIADRPGVVAERARIGDWESDNMEGKWSDKTVVSVTVDRTVRLARIRRLKSHTAPGESISHCGTAFQRKPVAKKDSHA